MKNVSFIWSLILLCLTKDMTSSDESLDFNNDKDDDCNEVMRIKVVVLASDFIRSS